MSNVYVFVKNQTKEKLEFVAKDKVTGAVIDLTGASITLAAYLPKSETQLFTGSCTITDDVAGEFEYVFGSNDLNVVGTHEGLVTITFADTKVGKIKGFYIKIETDYS